MDSLYRSAAAGSRAIPRESEIRRTWLFPDLDRNRASAIVVVFVRIECIIIVVVVMYIYKYSIYSVCVCYLNCAATPRAMHF